MPAGFVRTNRQSLKAKYIDCEIQISRHCYKPAWSNLQRTPGKCISHKLYKPKCVCLCLKQCLQRPLEVFTGQCPQVTCPSRNTKWTWTKYNSTQIWSCGLVWWFPALCHIDEKPQQIIPPLVQLVGHVMIISLLVVQVNTSHVLVLWSGRDSGRLNNSFIMSFLVHCLIANWIWLSAQETN